MKKQFTILIMMLFFAASAWANGNGPVLNTTQNTSYETIQAAIGAADDGDIIKVYPGDYEGTIHITVPNLSLLAVDANGDVIDAKDHEESPLVKIDGKNSGPVINIKEDNLGEIIIEGFHIFNQQWGAISMWKDDANDYPFVNTKIKAINNHIIADNEETAGTGQPPIQIRDSSGSSVIGNLIETASPWSSAAIMLISASDIDIKENIIKGSTSNDKYFMGINIQSYDDNGKSGGGQNGERSDDEPPIPLTYGDAQRNGGKNGASTNNIRIEDNAIIGATYGFLIQTLSGNIEGLTISGNTLTESYYAFALADYWDPSTIELVEAENNIFENNAFQVYLWTNGLLVTDLEDILADNTFDRAVVVRDSESDIKVPVIYSSIPAAIEVAGGGDMVDVREGEYDGFRIPGKVDLTIKGTGDVTIIPVNISGETAGVYIDSGTTGLVIDGFTFDGEGTATPNRGIIGIDGSEYLVKSSTFKNLNTGVYSNGTGSGNVQLTVQDNTFTWCRSAIGGTEATDPLIVTGNTFENNRNGIGIANDTDGIIISGNTFEIEDIDEVETLFGGNARYVSNRGNLQGEPAEAVIANNTFDPEARFALSGNNTTNIVPVGSGEINLVEIIRDGIAVGGYGNIADAIEDAEAGDQISVASGSYVGDVISPGNIVWSYGASPGCVTVDGNYIYQSTDVIKIDIWGDVPYCEQEINASYDQINVTGDLFLNNAMLEINLYNDVDEEWYNPDGESFTILIGGTLFGKLLKYPHDYVRAEYETGHKNFEITYENDEVVLTTIDDRDIDIAINELGCGAFEVVLIPQQDFENTTITELVFTLEYSAAVELTNINNSYFFIEEQTNTLAPANGLQYKTFIGEFSIDQGEEDPGDGNQGWLAGNEYRVLTFNHNQGEPDYTNLPDAPEVGVFRIWEGEDPSFQYSFYVEELGREVTGNIVTEFDDDTERIIGWISGCPVHNITQADYIPTDSDPAGPGLELYYYTIQSAITGFDNNVFFPGANVDDVLEAATWTFVENVVVDVEGVTLQPMTDAEPVIDGDGLGEAVVVIEANEVTLTGFTIQNSEVGAPGIAITGASECLVEDNLVKDNGIGIAILATDADANENIIRGNTLENNVVIVGDEGEKEPLGETGYGIIIAAHEGSTFTLTGNIIDDNDISGSKDAIYITEASSATVITNNLLYENYVYGIQNYKSDNNIIQGNTIINNGIVGNLDGADYDTQTARNTAGIRIGGGQNNDILNNLIYNETETGGRQVKGIRLYPSDDRIPDGNLIFNNSIWGHNEGTLAFNLDAHGIDVSPLLDVTCNWWGTADINDVLAGIRGAEKVVYLPLLINDDEETVDPDWPNGFNPIGPCEAPLTLKVWLQGPYDESEGEMKTDLNLTGDDLQIPEFQPFGQFPWNYFMGTETLPDPLPEEVVDWVLIELRNSDEASYGVIDRFAALLHKDGSVTGSFTAPLTKFHVVVYHRNHMPVMFNDEIDVSDFEFPIDLTLGDNVLEDSAIELEGGVFAMVAGDINRDGQLKYSGRDNDRGIIIARIVAELNTTSISAILEPGYYFEDLKLNNQVKYTGPENDRLLLLQSMQEMLDGPGTPLNLEFISPVPGYYTGPGKDTYYNDGPVNILAANDGVYIYATKTLDNAMMDNLQFTLAWKTDDLDAGQVISDMQTTFVLEPQGEVLRMGDLSYQVFVSVTPMPLPQLWNENDMVQVMDFGQDMGSRIWVADNAFTEENNAMYYVSIWGTDHTGEIITYDAPVGTGDLAIDGFAAYPNPVKEGMVTLVIPDLGNQQLDMAIYNLEGRLVKNIGRVNDNSEVLIDVNNLRGGVYIIRANHPEISVNLRLVVMD